VIQIDAPPASVDAHQVVINVPDVVQSRTTADGATPAPAATTLSPALLAAVSSHTLAQDSVLPPPQPTDDVQVTVKVPGGTTPHAGAATTAAKSTTGRRPATTLDTAVEVPRP